MALGLTNDEYIKKLKIISPTIVLNNSEYINSRCKISVKCTICNHIWSTLAGGLIRNNNTGCGKCSMRNRKPKQCITPEEWRARSIENKPNDYVYDLTKYVNQTTPIPILCLKHGNFSVTPLQHMHYGTGCAECGKFKGTKVNIITQDNFVSRVEDKFPNNYDLSNAIYVNQYTKVKVVCLIHKTEHMVLPKSLFNGSGPCPRCNARKRINGVNFVSRAKSIHGDKYDYTDTVFEATNKKVKILCHKHGIFEQRASAHLEGHGCSNCSKLDRRMSNDVFVKQIKLLHPELTCDEYTMYTRQDSRVTVKCKTHGYFNKIAGDLLRDTKHNNGIHGCPKCTAPAGEKVIIDTLDKHHISYVFQYKIPKSNTNYEYDFYIPSLNLLIEYDEKHHTRSSNTSNDIAKNNLADTRGYKLVRIKEQSIDKLPGYTLYTISKYGKYKYGNKFYNSVVSLCRAAGICNWINIKEFDKYRTYQK